MATMSHSHFKRILCLLLPLIHSSDFVESLLLSSLEFQVPRFLDLHTVRASHALSKAAARIPTLLAARKIAETEDRARFLLITAWVDSLEAWIAPSGSVDTATALIQNAPDDIIGDAPVFLNYRIAREVTTQVVRRLRETKLANLLKKREGNLLSSETQNLYTRRRSLMNPVQPSYAYSEMSGDELFESCLCLYGQNVEQAFGPPDSDDLDRKSVSLRCVRAQARGAGPVPGQCAGWCVFRNDEREFSDARHSAPYFEELRGVLIGSRIDGMTFGIVDMGTSLFSLEINRNGECNASVGPK